MLDEFPAYEEIHKDLYVRVRDLPVIDKIRDLRASNLGTLVRTTGVVTRRTGVFPQMVYTAFRCAFCNHVMEGVKQTGEKEIKPDMCISCQRKGMFLIFNDDDD